MIKTYDELYDDYKLKHNNKPKNDFEHFLIVLSKIHHHRELIRPKIIWWQRTRKELNLNNSNNEETKRILDNRKILHIRICNNATNNNINHRIFCGK